MFKSLAAESRIRICKPQYINVRTRVGEHESADRMITRLSSQMRLSEPQVMGPALPE